MKSQNKLGVDVPCVTPDEALEFMAHHLSLAAAYFEAIPEDHEANIKEIERLMDTGIEGYTSPSLKAAKTWLNIITYEYNEMRKGDEE